MKNAIDLMQSYINKEKLAQRAMGAMGRRREADQDGGAGAATAGDEEEGRAERGEEGRAGGDLEGSEEDTTKKPTSFEDIAAPPNRAPGAAPQIQHTPVGLYRDPKKTLQRPCRACRVSIRSL